jgi:hypothetical protein
MAAGDVSVKINKPKPKRCAVFDGVNDTIDCGKNSSQDITDEITISAWIAPTNQTSNRYCFAKWSGDQKAYAMGVGKESGNLFLRGIISTTKDNPPGGNFTDIPITNNCWTHLTIRHKDGITNGYINGVKSTTEYEQSGDINTADTDLIFGYMSGLAHFNGTISDVRLYNKGLTDEEIEDLSNGKNITRGIVSRWKLSENYEDSFGVNNGTNSGSYLSIVDGEITQDLSDDYTTANDKFKVFPLGNSGKVMSVHIEESA